MTTAESRRAARARLRALIESVKEVANDVAEPAEPEVSASPIEREQIEELIGATEYRQAVALQRHQRSQRRRRRR